MLEQVNADDFCQIIDDDVRRGCGRLTYLDAIVQYCNKNDINIEDTKALVNKKLKQKLREEGENLHYLKKTSRLPI